MRVSEFRDIDDDDPLLNATAQRSWVMFGLIVSLVLHFALCAYFYRARFQPIDSLVIPKQEAPTFKVKTVDLDQQIDKNSADQTNPAAKPEPNQTDVQLPDEKKSFDRLLEEVTASAAMPDDTQDALPETPKVEQANVNSVINEIERTTAQTLAQNPNATRDQNLLSDSSASGRPQPALSGTELATSTTIKRPNVFSSKIPGDSAGPTKSRSPGFSDLDQLLAQKGPLGSGTAIRMPSDLLFDYDSADLRSTAISEIQKLGMLIQRNAKATFTIEGHTDSTGSDDYNFQLSQWRADSVKRYLVEVMAINAGQIRTRGLGETKLLTSPDANVDEQQVNRRVVIVVHTDGA